MIGVFLLLLLTNGDIERLTRQIAASGRVLQIAVSDSERVAPPPQIAPGAPPLLSFRFFEL